MDLSDRIRLMISENGLKQKEFSKSINVTESYISKLIKGESGLSNSTALLMEERYGYSVDWILNGAEPKMAHNSKLKDLTPLQRKVIAEIEQMDEGDLSAVKAFIGLLGDYKKSFGPEAIG